MVRPIGIDLGTTYTVVATLEAGHPMVIHNAEGQRLTPSVVAFAGDREPLVGHHAKRQAAANPAGTVLSIKRRMGSDYTVKVGDRQYTPPEISSFILREAKAQAENHLGERIEQAVITVPAYFNDRQRQATREAGALAGLEVMRIINEPTAAALAYGLAREEAHTILVWDLGGGTFDVSILELGDGIVEVRAVGGDAWLGGDDLDQRVMDFLAAGVRRADDVNFPADAAAVHRLREAAEWAKIQLSFATTVRVELPPEDPGIPKGLEVDLSREQLERLSADLLRRMEVCTHQALADAELEPEAIDRVLLVGGATRMPAVRELVRRLTGKEPYRSLDPDVVVALGAAIQAGMLLGQLDKVVLLDVLPLSLGVETEGGLMAAILLRNTPLPASEGRLFTTAADYQTTMDIHVLQGERARSCDNVSLGQFQLSGIPSAPRGVPKVEVAFGADVDGIVHVSAQELLTENQVQVAVAGPKLLDSTEIRQLAEEAERSAELDQQERERVLAGLEADHAIAAGETVLDQQADHLSSSEREQVAALCSELRQARASGSTEAIRALSVQLRQLLQRLDAETEEGRQATFANTSAYLAPSLTSGPLKGHAGIDI